MLNYTNAAGQIVAQDASGRWRVCVDPAAGVLGAFAPAPPPGTAPNPLPVPPSGAVVPVPNQVRMSIEAVCWSTTLLKILLMAVTLILPESIAKSIADNLWPWMALYFSIQLIGTLVREAVNMKGWAIDNVAALIGVVFAIVLFFTPWFWYFSAPYWTIIKQCFVYGLMDLAFGLAFSQRIALATATRIGP